MCNLTSFRVLHAPKSWSKPFLGHFQPFMFLLNVFQLYFFPRINQRLGVNQHIGVTSKCWLTPFWIFFKQFGIFLEFFFFILSRKYVKTPKLVEIHNTFHKQYASLFGSRPIFFNLPSVFFSISILVLRLPNKLSINSTWKHIINQAHFHTYIKFSCSKPLPKPRIKEKDKDLYGIYDPDHVLSCSWSETNTSTQTKCVAI